MAAYSPGFKARMVRRMAGPERISASALSRDVGVPQSTLSRWLHRASVPTPTVPAMSRKKKPNPSSDPAAQARRTRTAEDKLRIVLDANRLPDEELGAFLRREGLHEAQLAEWRAKVMEAYSPGLAGAPLLPTPTRHLP